MTTIKKIGNVPVSWQDLGLYAGPIAVFMDDETDPVLHWKGSKLPRTLWMAIVSFMRWTYQEFSSEAQLRLYYNEITNRWKAVVLPQYIRTGMTSEEIKDHKDRDIIFTSTVPQEAGWKPAGTVHHHCSCSAFQSGTDWKDEIDQPGLHLTLGHMHNGRVDIHARASFRKVMYKVDLDEWLEPTGETLVTPYNRKFPKCWKLRCEEKPAPVYSYASSGKWNSSTRTTTPVHYNKHSSTGGYNKYTSAAGFNKYSSTYYNENEMWVEPETVELLCRILEDPELTLSGTENAVGLYTQLCSVLNELDDLMKSYALDNDKLNAALNAANRIKTDDALAIVDLDELYEVYDYYEMGAEIDTDGSIRLPDDDCDGIILNAKEISSCG